MSYLYALVVDRQLALGCPLEFRDPADARALAAVLFQYYNLHTEITRCTSSTIAQPFNLRQFSAWLKPIRRHVYQSLEDHYRLKLTVLVRPFPEEYTAACPPASPQRRPIEFVDDAPPLVNYYWQDEQLDREDFLSHLSNEEPAAPEPVNTWWFHTDLDRAEFEQYLMLSGEREWAQETIFGDELDSFVKPDDEDETIDADEPEPEREEIDLRDWDTSSDLFEIYSRAHDFDEWN